MNNRAMFYSQNRRKTGLLNVKYGALYNWYAASDAKLATTDMQAVGWDCSSIANLTTLNDYVQAEITAWRLPDVGVGNILKSRRQVNSPLGAPWATDEHPRWDENATYYGRDLLQFNGHGGGQRSLLGVFGGINSDIGKWGLFGSKTLIPNTNTKVLRHSWGAFNDGTFSSQYGSSFRLVRPATESEQLLPDGTGYPTIPAYKDYENRLYRVTKIGTQIWLADNLMTEYFNDGTPIPIVTDNTEWSELETAGMCYYDNDKATYA